ncbi:response regulator [Methylobacterium sp. NEAU 140]|uniref:response regulator n=1 Tax=Methylobacterium sp. NEAU 140 TaxID=3064945 RepID=UPI002734B716|nr:response regulator [Methylobacterium sp. NEAU 140]MDP4027282.1 response regulator [Methylobacterium sp. NEAU 140]
MSPVPEPRPIAVVVDDDPLIRMDVLGILEDAGFATCEAEDGACGIALLEQTLEGVELLFTDVQMPGGMDGFALTREVARRWPRISIVVASGTMRPGPADLPEGATFIAKPFSAEVVHDHLCELLPRRRQPAPLRERGSR